MDNVHAEQQRNLQAALLHRYIMKVCQLLAQVEKTSVFVSFYKKHLTCIDNWVSTSISLPANNDKNVRYDIVRIVTQGIV